MEPRTKNTRVLVALLAVFLANITVNAVILQSPFTDRSGNSYSAEQIQQLALDLGAMHTSVGVLIGHLDGDPGSPFLAGTVTAIKSRDSRYAVTAEHTLYYHGKESGGPRFNRLEAFFGSYGVEGPRLYRTVIDEHPHPSEDLVVLEFESGGLSDLPLATPYFGSLELGQFIRIVGRGFWAHRNGTINDLAWDGSRRGVRGPFNGFGHLKISDSHLIVRFTEPPHSQARPDGGRLAQFDSGCAAFLDNDESLLAGVVTRGTGDPVDGGVTAALAFSIPSIREFIEPFLETESEPIEPTLVPLADNEDEDGDGHTNFEEIVFGSDPRNSNSQPERYFRVTSTDGAILHFFGNEGGNWVDGNYVAGDVCYVVECSLDLHNWGVVEVFDALSGVDAPDGYVTLAYVCREVSAAGYFRIRVERKVD